MSSDPALNNPMNTDDPDQTPPGGDGHAAGEAGVGADPFSYDVVPYESFSYPHTQSPHLNFVGSLFKMSPPDVEKARVLELGCASGGNLLPLACNFPKGKFYGIDLSQVQIDEANRQVKELKLDNVTFDQMDIMEFPEDAGEFDYIIVHGILSWVPEAVSNKIIEIFGKHLAPKGLALVSYNCLPGWHFVQALREMMQFHAKRFEKPDQQLAQARAFLDFVHDNVTGGQESYKAIIDRERQTLKNANDSYFFHDHLEDENRQYYLHEVNKLAVENGLTYVGDTAVTSMFLGNLPKDAAEKLGGLNDVILQEQYMDFLNNRRFRNSVFSKASNTPNRALDGTDFAPFYVKPMFKAEDEDTPLQEEIKYKATNSEVTFTVKSKPFNALLLTLVANNQDLLTGSKAIKEAAKKYKIDEEQIRAEAHKHFFRLYFSGFFTLSSYKFKVVREVSEKPEVFKYARLLASMPGRDKVTSISGNNIPCDRQSAIVLRNADGTRTIDEIVEIFMKHMKDNNETLRNNGEPVTDEKEQRKVLRELVDNIMGKLAQNDLLVA